MSSYRLFNIAVLGLLVFSTINLSGCQKIDDMVTTTETKKRQAREELDRCNQSADTAPTESERSEARQNCQAAYSARIAQIEKDENSERQKLLDNGKGKLRLLDPYIRINQREGGLNPLDRYCRATGNGTDCQVLKGLAKDCGSTNDYLVEDPEVLGELSSIINPEEEDLVCALCEALGKPLAVCQLADSTIAAAADSILAAD